MSLYVSLVHSDDNSKRCISLSVTVHANAAPDIVEKDALTLLSFIIIGHNMLHRKSGRYINDTGRLFFN